MNTTAAGKRYCVCELTEHLLFAFLEMCVILSDFFFFFFLVVVAMKRDFAVCLFDKSAPPHQCVFVPRRQHLSSLSYCSVYLWETFHSLINGLSRSQCRLPGSQFCSMATAPLLDLLPTLDSTDDLLFPNAVYIRFPRLTGLCWSVEMFTCLCVH